MGTCGDMLHLLKMRRFFAFARRLPLAGASVDHEDPPHQTQTTHEYISTLSAHLRARGAAARLHTVRIVALLEAVRARRASTHSVSPAGHA